MTILPRIAIIELGSQYTLVIERSLRELGYRSVILDPKRAEKWLMENPVQAVILSGGPASTYDQDAPQPPTCMFNLKYEGRPVPVFGICYGMQWMAQHLGGTVELVSTNREYGNAEIELARPSLLFTETSPRQTVWASHGDSVTRLPKGFYATAYSPDGGIAAMENEEGTDFGAQFHPEVTHTVEGKRILRNFLEIAGCTSDWSPSSMIADIQKRLKGAVGEDERLITGYSGGVDSSVTGAITSPVFGDRLLAITIDGGHLRENEIDEIRQHAKAAGLNLIVIDARAEFEVAMADTIDAEEKRKRFKQVYVAAFEKAGKDFGATIVLQGTLAPDRIESGATGGDLIKSHHNVGLTFQDLKQAHPIDHLFKYEVRALARELNLPDSICDRQPFPGPGNFLRVNGIPATQHNLQIVQWAEARVREILVRRGLYASISQLVVSLNGVRTVGVKGDKRVYAYPIVVRAIETSDFMTAKGIRLPADAKDEIEAMLTRHSEIVCVYYNETDKPPATTEPE